MEIGWQLWIDQGFDEKHAILVDQFLCDFG